MIVKKFEEQVEKFPHKPAVITENKELTYSQLNLYANAVAYAIASDLKGKPIPSANHDVSIAALLFEHSADMVIGVIAALKAGKTYLPLDINYPENRLAYMLTDSGAQLILTNNQNISLAERLKQQVHPPLTIINLDMLDLEENSGAENIRREPVREGLAYILYTSGSTGKPRGVVQNHENVCYYIRNWTQRFSITPSDRMTLFSAFSHDGAGQDMFGALHNGAVLYPYNILNRSNIVRLYQWLLDEKITIWHSVPTLFRYFTDTLNVAPGPINFPDLRFILLGGEPLRDHDIEIFKEFFPNAKLANVYGQTESSVNSIWIVHPGDSINRMLIGEPLDRTEMLIAAPDGTILEGVGVGEIIVACQHLALGYWQDKKNIGRIFIQHPELGRIYRTGDLGRVMADGTIEFRGRKDSQVKIRGFRIEVGEIETLLLGHERINEAAVLARTESNGDSHLCAYYVPNTSGQAPGVKYTLTVTELREYLSRELPEHMIPSYFMPLEQLPLTPNGKVDRKRLPEPDHLRPQLGVTYVAPENDIEKQVARIWKQVLNLDRVGVFDNFFELGGTSLDSLKVMSKLHSVLNREIPVSSIFRYPTISSFTAYLKQQEQAQDIRDQVSEKQVPQGDKRNAARSDLDVQAGQVAVIGMVGRFPGARNVDELWEVLKNGKGTVTFFTDEELKARGIDDKTLQNPRYVKARGVLDNIEYFDAAFFNYTPAEAEMMDPQLRILHECAWEAFEHAGYDPETYDGAIGFYTGNGHNHYWVNLTYLHFQNRADTIFTNYNYSTKVSYKLNLHGPSVSVQTACSTSLVTVHMACRDLLDHQCDMALAGGISIMLPHRTGYYYQEQMFLSPDGYCRAFDAQARGTVFGDGVGIVVLKRLTDAIADGDRIEAVIRGSAVNNDGNRKVGLTAPSIEGQAEVIRAAMRSAKVEPESIGFVEAHGTGTILGDPIEIEALTLAYNSKKKHYCPIGSVKTNVGHLNIASGIVGLIKVILALKHRLIPKNLYFHTPNPKIDFENSPFYVNTELREWKRHEYPRRAAINSFGIGGTNAHAVLEEAPPDLEKETEADEDNTNGQKYQLLILSARTESTLDRMTENLQVFLEKNRGINLADVAYTLQAGRQAFQQRRMLVCKDVEEAIRLMSSPGTYKVGSSLARKGEIHVVFMFPGQGSQYVNMGLELYRTEPVFQREMDRCFEILNSLLDYDIREILYPSSGSLVSSSDKDINQTEIAQPLLFAVEYALAGLLIHWGVEPFAMMGHSIGEYVAAHFSGVFTLAEALKLVVMRGKLMQKLPPGSMMSVALSEKELTSLLEEVSGPARELSLAAVNTGTSCVVSGSHEAVDSFEAVLKAKGCECRRLHTSHAFHSFMMDPILSEFEKTVREIGPKKPQKPYISNLTGTWITVEAAIDPEYWAVHLRRTVRFGDGLGEVLKNENTVFVEIGPGRTLSSFVKQHEAKKEGQMSVNLVRHPKEKVSDSYYLLDKLGQLWLYGIKPGGKSLYPGKKPRRIPLPGYPFERQRYWLEGNPLNFGEDKPESKPVIGKKADITEWFYIPSWQPAEFLVPKADKTMDKQEWLLFTDGEENSFGGKLRNLLAGQGHSVTLVKPGDAFNQEAAGEYTLHPGKEENYDALLEACQAPGKAFPGIVHLWNVGHRVEELEQVQERGYYSLLLLARSLGRLDLTGEIQIMVVADGMQGVTGDDLLYPQKATIIGAIQVINREYTNIRCRSLDIQLPEPNSPEEQQLLARLTVHLQAGASDTDMFTAFRGQHRWLKSFEARPWFNPGSKIPRLKERGVYLITGGLGGIGLTLAGYLARTVKPGLILTGRRPFPAKDQWDNARDDNIRAKIEKLRELEKHGARVLIFSVDITHREQMAAVIAEAEQQLGKIAGVIHAAGIPDGALIQRRSREMSEQILGPKLAGTLVLDALLGNRKLDFMMLCSSIASMTAKAGQAAYCAGNVFLDYFAQYKHQRGNTSVVSVNWDTWQQVGMAAPAGKEPLDTVTSAPVVQQLTIEHPLFAGYETYGKDQEVFTSRLSCSSHWVIHDHRIVDRPTLPGTTYLEMVRAALDKYAGNKTIIMEDIYFLTPIVITGNEEKEICTIIKKQGSAADDGNGDGQGTSPVYTFSIATRLHPGEDSWIDHARGKVIMAAQEKPRQYDVNKLLQQCCEKELVYDTTADTDGFVREGAMGFGLRWQNIKHIKFGTDQCLGILELPGTAADDVEMYKLHPALMDVATTIYRRGSDDQTPYIPLIYKRLKIKKPLPARIACHIQALDSDGTDANNANSRETLKFDVRIMDEQGQELVEIEEFTLKRVNVKETVDTSVGKDFVPAKSEGQSPVIPGNWENFYLGISTPGTFDNLEFRSCPRRSPGPGEVEIKIHAAGLNFKEVFRALGLLKTVDRIIPPFGAECSGKITACGQGVEGLAEGDEVIAMGTSCFSPYLTTPVALVVKKPAFISLEEAATIPVAFLTAYHSFVKLARLGKGERVLIHSAAGGVGLAAVKVAQWLGAEIFATAGNEAKRKYLHSLGIRHVMNSRTPDFAKEIKEITGGKGVDVVLNSLAGESMLKSFSLLSPYGRFVEIGVRDMTEGNSLELRPFLNGLSYFAVNLATALPGIEETWQEVVAHFRQGDFTPLPFTTFPIADVVRAFEYMTAGTHIGKIIFSLQDTHGQPFYYFLSASPADLRSNKGIDGSLQRQQEQRTAEALKDAMLPDEGIEVFRRILGGERLPQVLLSTVDLSTRLKEVRFITDKFKQQRLLSMYSSTPGHSRSDLTSVYAAPTTDVEKKLADIFQHLLGIEKMGIDDDFFEMGGDSLKAITVIGRINQAFEIEIILDEIFNSPTIRKLAQYISGAEKTTFIRMEKVEEKEFYPVSYHQKRIWYLHHLAPKKSTFNIPFSFKFKHQVDEKAMETAVSTLMARHESLRTGFQVVNDEPVQMLLAGTTVPFKSEDISWQKESRKKEERNRIYNETAFQPFHISGSPLFRSVLVKWDTTMYEMIFTFHHLIFDGRSQQILRQELFSMYEALQEGKAAHLDTLEIAYRDFSQWQGRQLQDPAIVEKSHNYWKAILEAGIPQLSLRTDFKENQDNNRGAAYELWLNEDLKKRLMDVAKAGNSTLFVVMFSVYILFLHRFSQQKEIACSIVTAGRDHPALQNIIGIFVNSIPFKTHVDEERSFSGFLKRINRDMKETVQHHAYPFERVCDDLGIRPPQIPVAFNMLNVLDEMKMVRLDSFKPHHMEDVPDVRVDFEFYITDYKNGINLFCLYRKQLFKTSTIEYMVDEYIKLIDFFTDHPGKNYSNYLASEQDYTFKKGNKGR